MGKQTFVKQVPYKGIDYQIFRDTMGSVFVKFDNGNVLPSGRPYLKQLARGSIKNGTFSGQIIMKNKEGEYLHPDLRGSFVLKLLIDTEIESGKKFNAFKAFWVNSDAVKDNLNAFNKALKEGLEESEAAKTTWTSGFLKKNYEFNSASIDSKNSHYILLQRTDGSSYKQYTEATVIFSK